MSLVSRPVMIKSFQELDNTQLYKILQLRIEVFVVEQDCPYEDLDGMDDQGLHYWIENKGVILSYLRLNPPGTRFKEPSLGRIVTKKSYRKQGLGELIIKKALEDIAGEFNMPVKMSAQCYLEQYYAKFGFVKCSDEYLEDDIPHIEMVRA